MASLNNNYLEVKMSLDVTLQNDIITEKRDKTSINDRQYSVFAEQFFEEPVFDNKYIEPMNMVTFCYFKGIPLIDDLDPLLDKINDI